MRKHHKKRNPLEGNQGKRGEPGTVMSRNYKDIIPPPPVSHKRRLRRLASPAQVVYLQALRIRIGLDRWNELKADLGITEPGTYGLSNVEAGVLIETILAALEGKGE